MTTDHVPPSPPEALLQLGVCDYPEQVPSALWAADAQAQKALGLHFVRLAEFAWSRLEPQPGQYDWAWLDEAIREAVAAGLQIVLCTPTAAPPAWLVEAHPEILPVGRDGAVKTFGSRRHYDFASEVYREHAARITRAMAGRYGEHPQVIGWQVDNEFGWGDTAQSFSAASHAAFQDWLRARYGTPQALNEAWGNVFWSMEYGDFTQVPLPNHAVAEVNPAHALDFLRFSSAQVADFLEAQVSILREQSPGRFVTHNFMGFFSAYDHQRVARSLDFASWDSYPTGTLTAVPEHALAEHQLTLDYARTGHPDVTGFNHDRVRGLGQGRGFWIMEQQCGPVNWAPSNPLPAPGAVALWTAQAWAHGADAVCYFRWRPSTAGQEVLHSGLLRHSGKPDRGLAEVRALDTGHFPLGEVRAPVALLHDDESLWLYDLQRHAEGLSYWAQTFTYYRALRTLGLDVDVVHPDADLSRYTLVVAPALTLMTPERAAHLAEVARHARLVFGPRTAFRNAAGGVSAGGQFGPLADLVGAELLAYDSLPPGLEQSLAEADGAPLTARHWAESYELRGATALYRYKGGPQDGEAAVIRHGPVTVIGAHSEGLIAEVLEGVLHEVGLPTVSLPEGLRLSRRGGLTLLQNWTDQTLHWQGHELPPVSARVLEEVEVLA